MIGLSSVHCSNAQNPFVMAQGPPKETTLAELRLTTLFGAALRGNSHHPLSLRGSLDLFVPQIAQPGEGAKGSLRVVLVSKVALRTSAEACRASGLHAGPLQVVWLLLLWGELAELRRPSKMIRFLHQVPRRGGSLKGSRHLFLHVSHRLAKSSIFLALWGGAHSCSPNLPKSRVSFRASFTGDSKVSLGYGL